MKIQKAKRDIYQEVTDRIIEGLEGAGKWSMPWKCLGTDMPHNGVSGRPYNGINVLILSLFGGHYPTQQWVTYNQAKKLGGHIRKGEKATGIIFWKFIEKENKDTGKVETFPMLKPFSVFNVAQCEDLDESKITAFVPPVRAKDGVIEMAEEIGADVRYGGDKAFFIPSRDYIQLPSVDQFKDKVNHEATLLHELVHWTGHKSRLDRLSHHSYAEEELVAEIGAAMAGGLLGLPYEGLQHQEYVASWLEKLQGDKKYIFQAAKLAQKAVDLICEGIQMEEEEEEDGRVAA